MSSAYDRAALYYPYIHIRNLDWLKGTLLSFPQVRRIVPGGFSVEDDSDVQEFCKTAGATGEPLLVNEDVADFSLASPIRLAQARLLRVLQDNEEYIHRKYSMDPGLGFGKAQNLLDGSFRIHTGKMMYELDEYLKSKGLAIRTEKPPKYRENSFGPWVAVKEALGEAIMSIIAIAIAKDKGLDIVTSDGMLHHALAVLDEDEVFGQLVRAGESNKETSPAEKVDELVEVVMTSCFDLKKLTAKHIGELAKSGKDLRAFKTALMPIAESIPEIHNHAERQKRLEEKAADVIDVWKNYKKSLPGFFLEALVDTSEVKFPDLAAVTLAGGTAFALASGTGLAISLLTWKGLGIWRKYKKHRDNPYSYLSKIEKAGASLIFTGSPSAGPNNGRWKLKSLFSKGGRHKDVTPSLPFPGC
jgi:hypothetical protein